MLTLLLAATISCGELCLDDAVFWYGALLAEGGYGVTGREQAAFLIRERDGRLTLAPWSGSGDRHAFHRGVVPVGTIAIVHTHPRNETHPSRNDRSVARRLGIPVLVVTSRSVIAARGDGLLVEVAGRGWSARRERQAALEK